MKPKTDYNPLTKDMNLRKKASEEAKAFIKKESQYHLGFLPTEQSHPYTRNLSSVIRENTTAGLKLLLEVDKDIPPVARRIFLTPEFNSLCKAFEFAAREKKRVCFSGCGSTGRLSMMLEEMWRQYWEDQAEASPGQAAMNTTDSNEDLLRADLACSIMTGGDRALIRAVENFEDYEAFGARQVQDMNLQKGDLLIAITEGGETSSVLGTVEEGLRRQCNVFLVFNNPSVLLCCHLERSLKAIKNPDVTVFDLYTGPMALTGSTRMQATTMEMFVIGSAMETGLLSFCGKKVPEPKHYTDLFSKLLMNLTSDSVLSELSTWAEEEQNIYENAGRLTYLAEQYLLDIFSDTTERSPTFMLPPFRAFDDKKSAFSWAFARNPNLTADKAWFRMLRRAPRGLDWGKEDYDAMKASQYIKGTIPVLDQTEISRYLIGSKEDRERKECPVYKDFRIIVDRQILDSERSSDRMVYIGRGIETPIEPDYKVILDLPESPIFLWHHLAVKLIFNTVSTGSMALMGRISGNWMIQLDPTNKKLIDRGSRIISELLSISYEEACTELHLSLLAKEQYLRSGAHTTLSPVEAVLQRLEN